MKMLLGLKSEKLILIKILYWRTLHPVKQKCLVGGRETTNLQVFGDLSFLREWLFITLKHNQTFKGGFAKFG